MRDAGSGVGGHRVGSLVRRRVRRAAGASRSRQVHRTTCRPRSRNRSSRTFSSVITWPAVLPGGCRRPYVISPSNPPTTVDSRPTRSRRWRATGRTRRAPHAAGRERGARPCGTGHGSVTPRGSAPCTTAAEMWLTTAGGRAGGPTHHTAHGALVRGDEFLPAPAGSRRRPGCYGTAVHPAAEPHDRPAPRACRISASLIPAAISSERRTGVVPGRGPPRPPAPPGHVWTTPRDVDNHAPQGFRCRTGDRRPCGTPDPPVGPVLRNRAGRRGRPSGRWPGW